MDDEEKIARLRMKLIQHSINFVNAQSPSSYADFARVEARKIAHICKANQRVLRDLAILNMGMTSAEADSESGLA